VRRAKLYYLRNLRGKAARIKTDRARLGGKVEGAPTPEAEAPAEGE
jgi:large subunit ribosomal protein L19